MVEEIGTIKVRIRQFTRYAKEYTLFARKNVDSAGETIHDRRLSVQEWTLQGICNRL